MQVLDYLKVEYKDVNVLDDIAIREGVKKFSDWPTIPQLYVKGEFIGGSDIVREMMIDESLPKLLENEGLL